MPEPERQSQTSVAMARRFRLGDPTAVRQVRTRVGTILSLRAARVGQENREDLQQETMTSLWKTVNRSDFDPEAGFWGLVEVVTSRCLIDWLRRRRELETLRTAVVDGRTGPLQRLLARERSDFGARALAALGRPCRDLIVLHAVSGKSYRQIAPVLGKSEGALRVQMHRCVGEARRLLAGLAATSGRESDQKGANG